MSQIPEGAKTVSGEGRDLAAAIAAAATQLEVETDIVGYKLDLSHFRSSLGTSRAVHSVKIVAWADESLRDKKTESINAPPRSERDDDDVPRERRPRRDRDDRRGDRRDDRRERRDDRGSRDEGRRGAAEGTTEASEYAQQWFEGLLEHMDVKGTVTATGDDERVHLEIRAEKAGRVIGKRGATLAAIRHLLALTLDNQGHGELTIDVDVADERGENRSRNKKDGDRGDRGGRGRDRGGRDGGRDKRRRGGRREERGEHDAKKLQALARRAAERVLESGKPITINLKLNSYDRRLVHVEIAEIDGVTSRSEEREDGKVVQVLPE